MNINRIDEKIKQENEKAGYARFSRPGAGWNRSLILVLTRSGVVEKAITRRAFLDLR